MKKSAFIYIFFLLTFNNVIAQQKSASRGSTKITLNWGVKEKTERNEFIQDILYDDGQNIYTTLVTAKAGFMANKVTPTLVKFDSQMIQVKSVDYKTEEKNVFYHGTYYMSGRFILLTSKVDLKTNVRELSVQKLNMDLENEGKSELILTIAGEKGTETGFNFKFSEDKSKMFVALYPEQKKTENKKYEYKIFDGNLKEIYTKKIDLNIPSNQVIVSNVQLNNKGELFILSKIYNDSKIKEEVKTDAGNIPGFKYSLNKYSPDGKEMKLDFNTGDKFPNDISLKTDKNGDLLAFIAYREPSGEGINGWMYKKFDASAGTTVFSTDYLVPAKMKEGIDKTQRDNPRSKIPAVSPDFGITDFQPVDDGSAYAIMEKSFSVTEKNIVTYYSKGMLVFKFDPSGKVAWSNFIPKDQYLSMYSNFHYHTTMYYKNELFLFYNDEEVNANYDINNPLKLPKRFDEVKNSSLMMVEFDDKGKMFRKTLSNAQEMEVSIDMLISKQLMSNRMIFSGISIKFLGGGRSSKLGVATFE